jgi:hypothetical protein
MKTPTTHPQATAPSVPPAKDTEQRRLAELRPHPQAAEVPPLTEAEYETLRADIAAQGVLIPIEVNLLHNRWSSGDAPLGAPSRAAARFVQPTFMATPAPNHRSVGR